MRKPISRDGHAVVDLGSGAFSFSALLGATTEDPQEREEYARKTARQFSNFDETTFELVKEQMERTAEPSESLRRAYQAQVAARDLYLTLYEDFLREDLGVQGSAGRESQLGYLDQVEEELETVRTEALAMLDSQVALLASGQTALLAPPPGSPPGALVSADVAAHYRQKLDEHFEKKAAQIREVAKERQQLLEERFKQAGVAYHPQTMAYTPDLVVEIRKRDSTAKGFMAFHIEGTRVTGLDIEVSEEDLPRLMAEGYTVVSYTPVGDIEFMSQLLRVFEIHKKCMDAQQESTPA